MVFFNTFIKFCEVTPAHSCVRWCFALKGQCHKIFCFRFFSWIIFPQAFEIIIRIISNVFKNFRRYSQVKVHHLYQWHRRYPCCCCYRRQIFRGERSRNKFRNLVHQTANPKILRTYKICYICDLLHVWQFANLQFVDLIFFAICWSTFFCELKTTANPQIRFFLLTITYLKCSNSKFYQKKILRNKPADDF